MRRNVRIEGWGLKHMSPLWSVLALSLLQRVVVASCLRVHVVSDSKFSWELNLIQSAHSNITFLSRHGFPNMESTRDRVEFDVLVHADVLIGETSGYSRLAAVLSNHVAILPEIPRYDFEETPVRDIVVVPDMWGLFWNHTLVRNGRQGAATRDIVERAVNSVETRGLVQSLLQHLHKSLLHVNSECLVPFDA